MKDSIGLISESISQSTLKILLFGPQISQISDNERIAGLQKKRQEIQIALEKLGHRSDLAEREPSVKENFFSGESCSQSESILHEYDLIFHLVESESSITELGGLIRSQAFTRKSYIFVDSELNSEIVTEACSTAVQGGAKASSYSYPRDLTDCHLLGKVKEAVRQLQLISLML